MTASELKDIKLGSKEISARKLSRASLLSPTFNEVLSVLNPNEWIIESISTMII